MDFLKLMHKNSAHECLCHAHSLKHMQRSGQLLTMKILPQNHPTQENLPLENLPAIRYNHTTNASTVLVQLDTEAASTLGALGHV